MPGYAYLSRSVDNSNNQIMPELNVIDFVRRYNKLGDRQKKVLFSNAADRRALDKMTNIVKLNSEAFEAMKNPKTGQRLSEIAGITGSGLLGISGLGHGAVTGGVSLAALPAMFVSANVLNKILNSKKLREKYLKSLTPNGKKAIQKLFDDQMVKRILPALSTAIVNQTRTDNR